MEDLKAPKSIEINDCPVTFTMRKIGSKWKPISLYLIKTGGNHFGILFKGIEGISKQMLMKQSRELENDDILYRQIFPEITPRVEYHLAEYVNSLFPIIKPMRKWDGKIW